MPLAFAIVLAASDAHGQVPRDCGGSREASGEVVRVIDGRSFLLGDGREVRLAAIETALLVPGDEDEVRVQAARAVKQALDTLLLHREVDLAVTGGADRYGRLIAFVFVPASSGEILVQRELVATGHALVSPSFPAAMCRTFLRNAEREARISSLGVWGAPYYVVKSAADLADVLAEQGRFGLVQGKVTSVRESGGVMYVNFGRRWSEQFTVTILKRNQAMFASAGVTPKALTGRNIEVRGWIEERGGPSMEVTRPEQVEIVH